MRTSIIDTSHFSSICHDIDRPDNYRVKRCQHILRHLVDFSHLSSKSDGLSDFIDTSLLLLNLSKMSCGWPLIEVSSNAFNQFVTFFVEFGQQCTIRWCIQHVLWWWNYVIIKSFKLNTKWNLIVCLIP